MSVRNAETFLRASGTYTHLLRWKGYPFHLVRRLAHHVPLYFAELFDALELLGYFTLEWYDM